jgi:OmpA-OmpF porin, OOP family
MFSGIQLGRKNIPVWRTLSYSVLLLLAWIPLTPCVEAQTKFIPESQVTEELILQALKPKLGLPEDASQGNSRSIVPRVNTRPATPGAIRKNKMPPPPPPSAPILLTFETNSASLTDQAKRSLDVVARSLQHPDLLELSFAIEGHADPRGSTAENLRLSKQRAESVKTYLVTQHSLSEARLKAIGKGATDLAIRQNPSAPENRRVTFVTLQ